MDNFPFDPFSDDTLMQIMGAIPKVARVYRAIWIELEHAGFTEQQILSITNVVIPAVMKGVTQAATNYGEPPA